MKVYFMQVKLLSVAVRSISSDFSVQIEGSISGFLEQITAEYLSAINSATQH
jgi:hypothetical protein